MISSDDPPDVDGRVRIADHSARAVMAADVGFHSLAVAHRYSYGPAQPDHRGEPLTTSRFQPLPLLAYLSGLLGPRMDLVTTILLSASAHPVQLAEDVATLDAMSGGRLRLGVGLGLAALRVRGVRRAQGGPGGTDDGADHPHPPAADR